MKKQCKCTYPGCSRHGKCDECVEFHRVQDELPACYFDEANEKSYDRSINNYLKSKGK